MYNKAFELSYKNKKVEIEIQDFVGDVRNINGTEDLFSLSYISDSKDKGQSILVTEADINFYADDYFNIDELKTVGETDIKVKYYEDDALLWSGFVIPDFFSTSVDIAPVVSMVATDRVGTLKEISNNAESNIPIQILASCLKQTGQDLPINLIADNNHFETPIQLERIEEIASYDVIRSFMVLFNCKITLYKNAWWIINKKLLETGFVNYKSYNSDGSGGSVTPFAQPILDIDLVDRDGQREIKPTASEISLFLEFGGSKRYPNNWNLNKTFYDPTRGLQFIDWTGALYSVNTSKITGYDFIGNIQNAVLGYPLTDDKSMFYRSGIHPAFGNLNALTYPHFKSEFSTVKLLADTDYKLDFRLNFTSASKIFLEAYILIKKDNNYFVYGHKGKIASAGEGTPAIKNIDPFFIRSADREGFGSVQTQWNAELDINKSTLGILEDADGTFEVQIIIMKDRLGGTTSDILETDLFIYSAELALIDNEVESKGLIFKVKQGGEKFSKSRETETILFSDKINQGVNGYFYNYKYDDTSIVDLPSEFALTSVRERADMFSKARDYYSLDGDFIVNPLAKYACGSKTFVLVGGENRREDASIIIEEIVSNTLNRTDFIYTYFDDGKDKVKTIGTASGGSSSGGGGSSPSTPQLIKVDEDGNYYVEENFYSLKGLSALGKSGFEPTDPTGTITITKYKTQATKPDKPIGEALDWDDEPTPSQEQELDIVGVNLYDRQYLINRGWIADGYGVGSYVYKTGANGEVYEDIINPTHFIGGGQFRHTKSNGSYEVDPFIEVKYNDATTQMFSILTDFDTNHEKEVLSIKAKIRSGTRPRLEIGDATQFHKLGVNGTTNIPIWVSRKTITDGVESDWSEPIVWDGSEPVDPDNPIDLSNYYTKTQTYSKIEVNNLIPNLTNYYTKPEVNNLIPNLTNYYTKAEVNNLIDNIEAGGGGGGIINVIDNLTSTSKTDPLSANQGRYLKTLIDNIEVGEGGQVIVDWEAITGKPDTFAPSAHTHAFESLTSIPTTLSGYGITDGANKVHTHSISDVTNLQTELDKKATNTALTTHVNNKSNPHEVTKAQVGLGNVTNESKSTMFTNPTFTGTTKVTILELNTNWKVLKTGNELEFQYNNVKKATLTPNGDLIVTGGMTAYQ